MPVRLRLRLDRLAALVAASRLSQNHIAIRLGLSRGHWSDILAGKHPYPSARTRERLLEVFAVAEGELFAAAPAAAAATAGQAGGGDPESAFRLAIASRYEIAAELGAGGMGTVYLATDRALGRAVALKVVSPEAAAGIGPDQLLQEISLVSRLNHPHILPLFDAGARAGHPFYVMPLVRSGSLRALLRARTRLTMAEAWPLIDGIARALDHAHAHQVLHCDVKPENILVQDAHAYVADFGVARKLHSEAQEWTGVRRELDFSAGTPAYVSPEQAAGDRALDARSDVYSLACVVYEMLAGRAPFEGTTTQAVVSLRFRSPAPPLRRFAPDVPARAAAAIERAMALDPGRRPASPGAFARDLRLASSGASIASAVVVVRATRAFGWMRARLGASRASPRRAAFAGLAADLRYTLRSLRRGWTFAVGVIVTLGLGLGLGLPTLSLADHLFLRPPPLVADPARVVRLAVGQPFEGRVSWSDGLTGLDYTAMARENRTLDGVAASFEGARMSLGRGRDARAVSVTGATASYFPVLGVRPLRGRFYADGEDLAGSLAAPAVVSERYWRSALGADPDVLGRAVQLGTVTYTIVGVVPAGFNGLALEATDFWLPLHVVARDQFGNDSTLWTSDRESWLEIAGRLRPGVSVAAASHDATRVYRASGPRHADPEGRGAMAWEPLQAGRGLDATNDPRLRLTVWLAAGGLLLLVLIAANLLNLFLARNAANTRQAAIRLAIGGGRGRLLRLHLFEALLLGIVAAALGLAVSVPGVRIARALIYPAVTWAEPAVDWRIAWLALGAALATGALAAVWTAVQSSRVDPADLLRASGAGSLPGTFRGGLVRRGLVLGQSAIFTVLLAAAVAFVVSVRRATSLGFGYAIERVLVSSSDLASVGYPPARAWRFWREARDAAAGLPDVESASLGYGEPWRHLTGQHVAVPGVRSDRPYAAFDIVTPDYARTFGLRMAAGRWIGDGDVAGSEPVVVINEAFSRAWFPSGAAVGHCVRVGADSMPCRTVVGVVRDFVTSTALGTPVHPAVFLAAAQTEAWGMTPRLYVRPRAGADEGRVSRALRETLQSQAADVPVVRVAALRDNADPMFAPFRTGASVFSGFGLLAAIIASLGLYSVLAFLVVERRREYAIRVALGARATTVAAPVIRQAIASAAAGAALGLAGLVVLRPAIDPLLFRTRLLEPAVLAAVLGSVAVIAAGAAWIPVRRVLRTDAMGVLREQ